MHGGVRVCLGFGERHSFSFPLLLSCRRKEKDVEAEREVEVSLLSRESSFGCHCLCSSS